MRDALTSSFSSAFDSDIVKLGHSEEHREALSAVRAPGIRTSSGGVAAVAKAGGVSAHGQDLFRTWSNTSSRST